MITLPRFWLIFAPDLASETLPKAVQKCFRNRVQRKTRKRAEKDSEMGQLGPRNPARKRLKSGPKKKPNWKAKTLGKAKEHNQKDEDKALQEAVSDEKHR